ncbi:hypothetical protein C8R43DRAFT_1116178 [Mycena crocata]|nr:hypothetical protein C8R43DRAFT_1116178 [Mycena crocata]
MCHSAGNHARLRMSSKRLAKGQPVLFSRNKINSTPSPLLVFPSLPPKMPLLSRRLGCTQCTLAGLECAAFNGMLTPDFYPLVLKRPAPSRAAISHLPPPVLPSSTNYVFRRSSLARTGCARFDSLIEPWDSTSVCICGGTLGAHNLPDDDGSQILLPEVQGLPSVSQPAVLDLGFSTPPINAFSGVNLSAQSTAGNAPAASHSLINAQRTRSAINSLPQHQGPVANASQSYRGPHRPYPPPFLASGSSVGMSGGSPFGATPSSTQMIAVLIWPFADEGDHAPAGFGTSPLKLPIDKLYDYITLFSQHGLFFHPTLPLTGLASPSDFTRQLQAHLTHHRLRLPSSPPITDATPFHEQPFVVLDPKKYSTTVTYKNYTTMSGNSFSLAEIKKLNRKLPDPDTDEGHRTAPLMAIGAINKPTFKQQILPQHSRSLMHPCLPCRIVDLLTHYSGPHRPNPECMPGLCPDDEPDPFASVADSQATPEPGRPITPTNHAALIRQRSPTSQVWFSLFCFTTSAFLIMVQADPLDVRRLPIDDIILPHVADWMPARTTRPAVIALQPGVDVTHLSEVTSWKHHVRMLLGSLNGINAFSVRAEDTADAASTLLLLLLSHLQDYDEDPFSIFTPPPNVSQCVTDISLSSFFLPFAHIRIGSATGRSAQATGPGPQRATFRAAAALLASNTSHWMTVPESGFVVPKIGINPDTSLQRVRGKESMIIPANLLLYLDPGAYNVLEPWYNFHFDSPLPRLTNINNSLLHFLINILEMQPSDIEEDRTPEEHQSLLIMAFSRVLLGHSSPWTHPKFLALQRGFNITIGDVEFSKIIKHRFSPLAFLIALNTDSTTLYFAKLFEVFLQRYVHGCGHPSQLSGVEISEADIFASRNDPLLRANLLLGAAGDTDMCPMDDEWKITFQFHGRPEGLDTVRSMSTITAPLHFHTCTYEVDVTLDKGLEGILLAGPGQDDSAAGPFDVWIHSQVLARKYNSL